MIRIEKAKIEDAKELTEIAKKTFLDDNKLKPENASMEGPPGHDKITEQDKWIKNCFYYKALYGNKIVGGGLAWKNSDDDFCIDGMFIDPDYQNRNIGSKLIEHILKNHKPSKKWTLSTPSFSKRNHHFYEKYGFVKIKEEDNGIGWKDFYYEKLI